MAADGDILRHKHMTERTRYGEWYEFLKPQILPMVAHPSSKGCNLPILPEHFHQVGVPRCSPRRAIFIQTTIPHKLLCMNFLER